MYKNGDKIQFIEHDALDIYSGKKGTVERLIDDEIYGDDRVYEVYVPFHGFVQVLSSFIKPIKE